MDVANVRVEGICDSLRPILNSGIPITSCTVSAARSLHGGIRAYVVVGPSTHTVVLVRRNALYVNSDCRRTFGVTNTLRAYYREIVGSGCLHRS